MSAIVPAPWAASAVSRSPMRVARCKSGAIREIHIEFLDPAGASVFLGDVVRQKTL